MERQKTEEMLSAFPAWINTSNKKTVLDTLSQKLEPEEKIVGFLEGVMDGVVGVLIKTGKRVLFAGGEKKNSMDFPQNAPITYEKNMPLSGY